MLNYKRAIAVLGICILPASLSHAASVSLSNNGFESSWTGWTVSSSGAAISTSDVYAGSKSAKLTSSSGKFSRAVSVSANTNYSLSAYILGKGKLNAVVNGTTYTASHSGSSWTKKTVTFNSGSATSITISGTYNSGEGRFDAFTLDSTSVASSSVASSVAVSSSSSSPVSSGASSSANPNGVPADLSDVQFLKNWKITLPISFTNDSNKAGEIKHPTLKTYSHPDYFKLGANGTSIVFKSIAGGARTSTGTAYARSELREMKSDGTTSAAWNCTGTSNGMSVRQKLLTTTKTEAPNATVAQIHDASNDNLMVKYFGPATGANGVSDTGVMEARFNNDTTTVVLDTAYRLGDEHTIDVTTTPSGMRVVYKNLRTGATKDTRNPSTGKDIAMVGVVGSCYYKAGLYIQTCSKIDYLGNTNSVCVSKNFAEGRYATTWDSSTLEMYSLILTNPQ
jgi:hypothetical protein